MVQRWTLLTTCPFTEKAYRDAGTGGLHGEMVYSQEALPGWKKRGIPQGQDGPAPAGVPGPAQYQVGPGHGDGHVQEGAGRLRRNIVMKILEMPDVEVMKESKQEHKDVM